MGTNYYLAEKPPCACCGRSFDRLHIGKSSAGWCFSLHVLPDDGINDLPDWQARWSQPGATIWNEYGEQISADDMLKTIAERKYGGISPPDEAWLVRNGAERSPSNLARNGIGGHCIGHGASTYDLIRGEFS